MNDKEIREIRRRFRPDKSMISTVRGCYVNEAKKIISTFEESLQTMPQEESERFLGLLKKSISGTLGKNLVNIEFEAKQVMEGEEYKLLAALRGCSLKEPAIVEAFYERVAQALNIDGNYLILLTQDVYTVPYRAKDDTLQQDAADEEFSYFVCSICQVKLSPSELGYHVTENCFRALTQNWVVSAPELGFMFPAFDGRSTNIYGALYYSKNPADNHSEFIDTIFHVEPPMPAAVQKETFETILAQTLHEDCKLEVIQAVHEQLADMIDRHKENNEPDQLALSGHDIGAVLSECGVSEEHLEAFSTAFEAQFGAEAQLSPKNVIDKKQFVIKTADATIKVDPERSDLIEIRKIDGMSYILIPADGGVEVNGVNISTDEMK